MLTEPHGLNYITSCEQEGFHTHPKEPPLYEVSQGYNLSYIALQPMVKVRADWNGGLHVGIAIITVRVSSFHSGCSGVCSTLRLLAVRRLRSPCVFIIM